MATRSSRSAQNPRRQGRIVREAARLLRSGQQPDLPAAVRKAARRVCRARPRIGEIPDPREVAAELERLAYRDEREHDDGDDGVVGLGGERRGNPDDDARFAVYRALLDDLADVKTDSPRHPEGDCLTHSLQVYSFALASVAWDEEFLLAALLHDVGKAIYYRDPVPAGLEALDGWVTDRTRWFVELQSEGRRWVGGDLSPRALRRLTAHPDGELLKTLARCDAAGTRRAMRVPQLDEALGQIRALSDWAGGWEDPDEPDDAGDSAWGRDADGGWG